MNIKKYPFLVIEGTDGSGKTVQFNLLVERLKKNKIPLATADFPQYGKPSSFFVKEYLNGRYGTWKEVGPYKTSLFYAMDRFDAGFGIKKAIEDGKMILSNRYVASNMGHQGAKIEIDKERIKYFEWLYNLEYEIIGIPKPTQTIILHVPAEISQQLVDKKGKREYLGGKKRDIHEQDIKHLLRAEKTYISMAKMFPDDFVLIECAPEGKLLTINEIHDKIWRVVKKIIGRKNLR